MTKLISADDQIFMAGHRGMAGSAICRALQRAGYTNLLAATRAELNLEDGSSVQRWFAEHKPTVVVLAIAMGATSRPTAANRPTLCWTTSRPRPK